MQRWRPNLRGAAGGALLFLVTGCASSGIPATATDTQWRQFATPRPSALEGAPRITIAGITTVGLELELPGSLDTGVLVQELVTAGLLHRRDIRFVERRRFAEAVLAERNGTRPAGAPPAGVSERASHMITASWFSVGSGRGRLDIRLVGSVTGSIDASSREEITGDVDAVTLSRAIVAGALALVDEVATRPEWTDPSTLPEGTTAVSADALASFAAGLAAEERWSWEEARRGYQEARGDDFPEAGVLLARTARLRIGGTLGES